VRITGVIVAVDKFSARKIYTIDDSSGMCIECTCPAPAPALTLPEVPGHLNQAGVQLTAKTDTKQAQPTTPSITEPLVPWDDLDVGVVVKIKGKPGQFRDMKQIEIVKAEVIRSTQQEVRCWDEVFAFRKEVLDVPWVVGKEEEEKLRRKAVKEKQFSRTKGKDGRRKEESRKKRKEAEMREERHDESKKRKEAEMKEKLEENKKRRKEKEAGGLKARNKVNCPSLAARKLAAEKVKGKYDALGI
jgi:endo-1,3(4)-beta-glucanase